MQPLLGRIKMTIGIISDWKKIKGLYTRQKAIEKKNPGEGVTKTVHNFMSPKPLKTYPAVMQYGIRNEQDAKLKMLI